jgi:hypothetical protein
VQNKLPGFYNWFYELEGFSFRAQRMLEDLGGNEELYDKMLPWLKAAYLVGKQEGDEVLDLLKDIEQ